MDLAQIRHLVSNEQAEVDQLIIDSLYSNVPLIEQIGHYIVDSGGKRLRPLMVLLAAMAAGYQGKQHLHLAAIIEFIHTATLLHDDVVDESMLRRGRDTANAVWGDHTSVLVGDFIYSRAFQMMVTLNNMRVMEIMAQTTNKISEGEVLQLLNARDPETTEARYFEVIKCKTAILFAAGCEMGGTIKQADAEVTQALHSYGLNFGIAYQLIDDVLDYSSDADTMGKNVGDDLAEGKPTLPLIYILQHGSPEQAAVVKEAIEQASCDNLPIVQAAITQTGALDYTKQQALKYAAQAVAALDILAESPYKAALVALCDIVISRNA
jgi:octaprenyl-diphosphate synthase